MKKEGYLPLDILKKITAHYPKAWEQMEMFHNANEIWVRGLNGVMLQ